MQENRTEQDAAFAAEFNADVSREKIAEVYAKALAGACDAMHALKETSSTQMGKPRHRESQVHPGHSSM